jgi:hypothetical protein
VARSISIPLVNRSAEALEALLNYDDAKAEEQVRLLTMSEIVYLSAAAKQLVDLAGKYINRRCVSCDGAIVWDANFPTQQQPRWRHVDQARSCEVGAHRASPAATSTKDGAAR